jgi:hypothetical protein
MSARSHRKLLYRCDAYSCDFPRTDSIAERFWTLRYPVGSNNASEAWPCDDGDFAMKTYHSWARLLAYVTGLVNRELLLQAEYVAAENRILRAHLPARLRLSNPERAALGEIGRRVGRKALAQVACVAKPETILCWYAD